MQGGPDDTLKRTSAGYHKPKPPDSTHHSLCSAAICSSKLFDQRRRPLEFDLQSKSASKCQNPSWLSLRQLGATPPQKALVSYGSHSPVFVTLKTATFFLTKNRPALFQSVSSIGLLSPGESTRIYGRTMSYKFPQNLRSVDYTLVCIDRPKFPIFLFQVRATTSSGTAASVPYGLAVYLQGIRDKLNLSLVIVSEDDPGKRTENFVLTGSRCTPWRRDDANEAGTLCETEIDLPEGFKPGTSSLIFSTFRCSAFMIWSDKFWLP